VVSYDVTGVRGESREKSAETTDDGRDATRERRGRDRRARGARAPVPPLCVERFVVLFSLFNAYIG